MLPIFNITAPLFALVLCGWLAARVRRVPVQTVAALNGFILYFALPAMLFRFVATSSIAQVIHVQAFVAYAMVGGILMAVSVVGLRWGNRDNWIDSSFGAVAASWANWGYMGFGIIPTIYGKESLGVLISAGMADLVFLVPVCLMLAARQNLKVGQNAAVAGLMGALRNPLVLSIAAGLAASLASLPIPGAVDEFLRLLGTSAGPVALFSIGVSLYRPHRASAHTETWILVVTKLIAHPLLMWIVAYQIMALDRQVASVLTLMAALPAAGTAFLFVERYNGNMERISGLIMITTALAFLSFSFTVALIGR